MINILKANKNDLKEILELQKLCFQSEVEIYKLNISPINIKLEDIEKTFDQYIYLKAVHDYKIIGSVKGNEKDLNCYIGNLIVHPDYQNKGLGNRLLFEIEKEFNYVKKYSLFTGHKSEKNIHLYQKNGYKIIKEEYISANDPKMVFMEKIISTDLYNKE